MKTWNPFQHLSEANTEKAKQLYQQFAGTGTLNRHLVEDVVRPNIKKMEAALGQEMDEKYVTYAIEYILNEAS